jgi:hypothetical protein
MNSGRIRIGKVSLRLRGVTRQEAQQRAGSIAREIAGAVAREAALKTPGKAEIGQLSVRLRPGTGAADIAGQIRNQWSRE